MNTCFRYQLWHFHHIFAKYQGNVSQSLGGKIMATCLFLAQLVRSYKIICSFLYFM